MKLLPIKSLIKGFFAISLLLATTTIAFTQILKEKNYIRVDQFGYLPNAPKIAVIAKAVKGFNAGIGIDLDTKKQVELRSAKDQAVVFSALAPAWTGGETDSYSGDKGWWFNFTNYTTQGDYFIRVYKTDGGYVDSYGFSIKTDIYSEPLRAAMNMFYYQRVNQKKTAEYASGANWVDEAWYEGTNQEKSSLYLLDTSKKKDTSKGWFDAGDPNKYITFAGDVVHDLLQTYENHPAMWDKFNLKIPESKNTVPDILDEIKWEIDYIRNMVDASTGGIHIKSGIKEDGNYISPPSTDNRTRYYDKVCANSSAVGAGMLAHASLVFKNHKELETYAAELIPLAERAFTYYENAANKGETCDNGEIEAGDADGDGNHYSLEHLAEANCAAIYLYSLTGKTKYNDFVKANYKNARPFVAGDWGVYRPNQALSLLYYTKLPNADASVKNAILAHKTSPSYSSGEHYEVLESKNLYRAVSRYQLWGSNSLLARMGNDNMDFINYNLLPDNHSKYREKALGMVNYFHGVNPFGMCFVSNMYMYGAEYCYDEMWHSWFKPETKYDNIVNGNVGPAPGYLTGGHNIKNAGQAKMKIGTDFFEAFARDQPDQKSYSNDNTGGPANPWVFNEPGLYYNSGYVKLLANFVAGNAEPVIATEIALSPAKDTLSLGKSLTMKASLKPSNATNQTIIWSVSDATVASISTSGVLTGLKAGKVTVTAKAEDGKLVATSEITVAFIAIKSLKLSPETSNVYIDASLTLTPEITPLNASNNGFTFTSSDEKIAIVTAGGNVIGKAVGKVDITCTAANGTTKAKATITVEAVPALEKCGVLENGGFEVGLLKWTNNNNSTVAGTPAKTGKFAAVVEGDGGVSYPDKFKVKAKSIVTLKYWGRLEGTNNFPQMGVDFFDATGAEKAEMTIVVPAGTGNYTEFSKSYEVPDGIVEMALWSYKGGTTGKFFIDDVCLTVVEPVNVTSVTFAKTSETVKVNETVDLAVTILPANANNKTIRFSSSDNNIATVNDMGRVTGVKVGTANIVVTSDDGGKSAKVEITVAKADDVAVCGVVENGDFEVDLSRWENINNASKITADVKGGKKALVIEAQGGVKTKLPVPLKEDNEFTLSTWAKQEGSATGILGISFLNASGFEISKKEVALNTAAYSKASITQRSPFGTKSAHLYVSKENATGKLFVDDVCLEVASVLANEPHKALSLKLYPIPAFDVLTVQLAEIPQKHTDITIFSATGKAIITTGIAARQTEIKISVKSLSKGVYFVKVLNNSKTNIQKILIQ